MNIPEIVRSVLSRTCDLICEVEGISREEVYRLTEAFIKENSEAWRTPNPSIDYRDPFCRMAYLYMNTAIHGHLLTRALSLFSEVSILIASKRDAGDVLNVCALGGGPGSELLGLVSFIEKNTPTKAPLFLDFLLVDKVKEWDESWHILKLSVEEQLKSQHGRDRRNWPVLVSRSFLPLSAVSLEDFQQFVVRFSNIDLFVFSYIVSEVEIELDNFEKVFKFLVSRAADQAAMIFIDRNERKVREGVASLINLQEDLSLHEIVQDRGRWEMEVEDLGEWFVHIKPIPRRQWSAFFALATKEKL